ncbi:Protein W06H8.2, partial [Aphelenchoides avenae]
MGQRTVRKETPASTGFIVGVKINSAEFQGGFGSDDDGYTAEALDKSGFDFIELTGGTYKKPALEQNEINEARRIKPRIKNAKVYVTGGFRTVQGMVAALEMGGTDGVGLARPSAAEP